MDTKAYSDWQKEESGNVANDGMFSIQASPGVLALCRFSQQRMHEQATVMWCGAETCVQFTLLEIFAHKGRNAKIN